jgi:hypothetical protein
VGVGPGEVPRPPRSAIDHSLYICKESGREGGRRGGEEAGGLEGGRGAWSEAGKRLEGGGSEAGRRLERLSRSKAGVRLE